MSGYDDASTAFIGGVSVEFLFNLAQNLIGDTKNNYHEPVPEISPLHKQLVKQFTPGALVPNFSVDIYHDEFWQYIVNTCFPRISRYVVPSRYRGLVNAWKLLFVDLLRLFRESSYYTSNGLVRISPPFRFYHHVGNEQISCSQYTNTHTIRVDGVRGTLTHTKNNNNEAWFVFYYFTKNDNARVAVPLVRVDFTRTIHDIPIPYPFNKAFSYEYDETSVSSSLYVFVKPRLFDAPILHSLNVRAHEVHKRLYTLTLSVQRFGWNIEQLINTCVIDMYNEDVVERSVLHDNAELIVHDTDSLVYTLAQLVLGANEDFGNALHAALKNTSVALDKEYENFYFYIAMANEQRPLPSTRGARHIPLARLGHFPYNDALLVDYIERPFDSVVEKHHHHPTGSVRALTAEIQYLAPQSASSFIGQ